jgi:hypothetical protein
MHIESEFTVSHPVDHVWERLDANTPWHCASWGRGSWWKRLRDGPAPLRRLGPSRHEVGNQPASLQLGIKRQTAPSFPRMRSMWSGSGSPPGGRGAHGRVVIPGSGCRSLEAA